MARNVFDATGAGDIVCSTLAVTLATGATLEQAVFLANQAAGIVVGKVGTAMVTIEELVTALETELTAGRKPYFTWIPT